MTSSGATGTDDPEGYPDHLFEIGYPSGPWFPPDVGGRVAVLCGVAGVLRVRPSTYPAAEA